jgi:hypothetical protein
MIFLPNNHRMICGPQSDSKGGAPVLRTKTRAEAKDAASSICNGFATASGSNGTKKEVLK